MKRSGMRGRRSRMTLSPVLGLAEGKIRGAPSGLLEGKVSQNGRTGFERFASEGANWPNEANVTERSQTETPTHMERRAMRGRRPEVNWQNEAKRKSRMFSKEA